MQPIYKSLEIAMYSSRKRRTNPLGCLLGGTMILLGVIGTFTFFQSRGSLQTATFTVSPIVTAVPQKTAVPSTPGTPVANTLRIFSDKALIAADVTEVRYGKTDNWDVTYLG